MLTSNARLRGCLGFAGGWPGLVGWPVCGLIGPQRLGDCLGGYWPRAIDWPVWLTRAIGPGLIGRGWCNWGGLARLLGAIGGGLQRLGRVGWPSLIGAGLAPGQLGGAGRLAPNHANPGGLCNYFPVILHFL